MWYNLIELAGLAYLCYNTWVQSRIINELDEEVIDLQMMVGWTLQRLDKLDGGGDEDYV